MSTFRCVVLLFLFTLFCRGQASQKQHQSNLSKEAEYPVRMLYQQLASQPVGGIPKPERMKSFAPYISDSLQTRISQARACGDDWFRLHPTNEVKAPLVWLEFGIFSGADDRSGPHTFQIEKAEVKQDGSIHVYIRLTEGNPPEKPWTWRVAAIVIREKERLVINDVIFLRDKDIDKENRLSDILTRGCDGSHWVGYTHRPR